MTAQITIGGTPHSLSGHPVKVGEKAPDAELTANDLSPVKLSSYRGRIRILSVVGSLDTSVCDTQTRRFNQEAARLGDDVVILTISMDLPFAQKRWCGAAGVDKVVTLSDHRTASFGQAYGVLVEDVRLLARAIFVIDAQDIVRHVQIVKELSHEPDYDAVLAAVRKLV
ncbi:MAG: thiol peroxidase [Kiritimatiellae bacterium]|nr:thiol peroxidase [Kiritimatiellia bacterium]